MIAAPLRATFGVVAAAMAGAAAPWWIIGSAAVRLHGAAGVSVADVDVLAHDADARLALDRLGVAATLDGGDALFRSDIFGRYLGTHVPIEIIAGFAVRGIPVWPATRVFVSVADLRLPVPARAELIALLRQFGRAKDYARVALLEKARNPGTADVARGHEAP